MGNENEQKQDSNIDSSPRKFTVKKPRAGIRESYSFTHLLAVKRFAELATELNPDGLNFNVVELHKAYVVSTITSSVAFIESAINEFLSDIFDNSGSRQYSRLNQQVRDTLTIFWQYTGKEGKSLSTLDKYQVALAVILDKSRQFDKGLLLYQRVSLLIRLRNELIHYKPKTQWKDNEISKLYKGLRDQGFNENTFYSEKIYTADLSKLLSFECAQWAVTSSKEFVDEFFKRIDVIPHYQYRLNAYEREI